MSATLVIHAGGTGLAIRGIGVEILRSWFAVPAILVGIAASIGSANAGSQSGMYTGFLVQVLMFGTLWITRLPCSRLLMILPQTRAQTETTLWATSFAMPVLYYVVVFGSAGVWSVWHGRSLWPALLMMLDGVALQGLGVLAWSFQPDAAGRIGWPGWTRRSARRLGVLLGGGGVALCFSPGLLPRHDAPGALALALIAGLPAALLVALRRDILPKLHVATAANATTAPGRARGWLAFGQDLLPTFCLALASGMLVPVLISLLGKDVVRISPVVVLAPVLLAFALPKSALQGLRVIRLLPVPSATIATLLMAAMALVPCATCSVLASAFRTAPAWHGAAYAYIGWIMPAAAVNLLSLPLALRFERLWLMGAFATLLIAGLALFVVFVTHGTLPRIPLADDLVACVAVTAGCFIWLRREVSAARGIGLRFGINS